MKKLLALIVSLMLIVSAVPSFAAESAIDATEFANGTEYEYNLKTLNNGAWDIDNDLTKNLNYTADINKGSMAIFKLSLPRLADGQEFADYTFKFCDSKEASNRSAYYRVVGLEGISEDALRDGTLTTKDEPVASAINWDNYNNVKIVEEALEATEETAGEKTYYTYKADITAYANERLEEGDDVLYIGVYCQYSYGIFGYGDSSLKDAQIARVYFTTQKKQTFEHTIEGYKWVGNRTRVTDGYAVAAGVPSAPVKHFTTSYIADRGNFAVYKIALPKVAEGEGYKHFIISTSCGSAATYIMMPGEDWDFTKSLADTYWYNKITVASTAEDYKANDAAVLVEENQYYNKYLADITTYANQCLNAGQEYMYIAAGAWSKTSNVAVHTMSDSSYVAAELYPQYYYKVGDAVETPDLPPVAEEAPAEVPFEHTITGYQGVGNLTAVPESYKVVNGVPTAASGNWGSTYMSGSGEFVIYKINVPAAPEGKEINHFILRFGGSEHPMRVFRMPGTDWDLTKSLADTDWYKAVTVEATSAEYYANDEAILAEEGASYNNYYADITNYVKECALSGQEYFYVVATAWNSRSNVGLSTMTDGDYVRAGHKPQYYYSFADVKPIEFKSSSVEDGGFVADVDAGVDFLFSAQVESATATVNDVTAETTVENGVVTVKGLVKNAENKIEVIATDALGNEASASITVYGYGKANLTKPTYTVTAQGSKASTYNPSSSYASTVIFQLPLPKVAEGKEIDNFTFNFLTPIKVGATYDLVKLPGEDWVAANLIQTSGEVPEGLTNIYDYSGDEMGWKYVYDATRAKITTERVDIAPSATTEDGKSYLNHANLSEYARECIANGQSTMWLAVRSISTQSITGIGDSSHAGAGRYHTVTWTFKDADVQIAAPKAVLATDAASYDEAAGATVLATETEYKLITKANIAGKLVVAKYNANGTLASIDAIDLDGTGAEVSATFTTGADAGFVKAFVWAADKMAPVDDDITVLAIK